MLRGNNEERERERYKFSWLSGREAVDDRDFTISFITLKRQMYSMELIIKFISCNKVKSLRYTYPVNLSKVKECKKKLRSIHYFTYDVLGYFSNHFDIFYNLKKSSKLLP